ncbi:hypothetical protein EV401DRAFT_1914144, partial [Pisolithus croceorrhizus]
MRLFISLSSTASNWYALHYLYFLLSTRFTGGNSSSLHDRAQLLLHPAAQRRRSPNTRVELVAEAFCVFSLHHGIQKVIFAALEILGLAPILVIRLR